MIGDEYAVGEVALPFLTQADLCAFGAAHKSLICERTWEWWTALSDDHRESLTARSMEILVRRGLVRPATGDIPAGPVPELGLILDARIHADLIITSQVPGRDPGFEPRFFGLPEEGDLRTLVREVLTADPSGPSGRADFGTILRYALMGPSGAARAIAAWARAKGTATAIDLFGHAAAGGLSHDRIEIRPAGDLFDVLRPAGAAPPGSLDHAELRWLLTDAITSAGR
jgi:hypothetical protein